HINICYSVLVHVNICHSVPVNISIFHTVPVHTSAMCFIATSTFVNVSKCQHQGWTDHLETRALPEGPGSVGGPMRCPWYLLHRFFFEFGQAHRGPMIPY
ncbi:unnamed protein product, partial [Staurois parvus]